MRDTQNPKARELYNKANGFFNQKKFEEAIKLFSETIAEDSTYASAYLNRALAYAILDKYPEATEDAEKVMALEPDSCDAPYVMGIIYEYLKDFKTAKEWYEKSLAKNPNYEAAKSRLASLNEKMNNSSRVQTSGQHKIPSVLDPISKSVMGMIKQKRDIYMEIVLPLSKPTLVEAYGKKVPSSVMLYGPPGCGKTLITKYAAEQARATLIECKMAEAMRNSADAVENEVSNCFDKARQNKPAIVFFDELDALGVQLHDASLGYTKVVSNISLEIDKIASSRENILVVGATDAPWLIPEGLLTNGRFSTHIYMPPPGEEDRELFINYYLRPFDLYLRDKTDTLLLDYLGIVNSTKYYSYLDIKTLCENCKEYLEESRKKSESPDKLSEGLLNIVKNYKPSLPEWYEKTAKSITGKETQYTELTVEIQEYQKDRHTT